MSARAKRRCAVCHAAYTGDEAFCPRDGGAIVAEAADEMVGKTIDGRYLVLEPLGRGGMGKVYAAEHVGLGKRVAIKLISDADADRDQRARFRREARAASKIAHDNVVQIFDVGVDDGRDYIAMELVEGRDLDDVLRDGPMPIARAIVIARQLLRGLHAVHEAGIVHRDVKPQNIRVIASAGGAVKLMDFGIAKPLASALARTDTGNGNVVGTPQFMAPEQLLDGAVDHRADLYAVGATLYTMLAGEYPFAAGSFTQRIAAAAPRPLDELRAGVPPAIIVAIERALAREPADRFADALAFDAALADAGEATVAKQEAPTVRASQRQVDPHAPTALTGPEPVAAPRARSLVPVVVALSVLLAIAGTLVVVLLVRSPEPKQVVVVPVDAAAPIDTAVAPSDQTVATIPLDAAIAAPLDAAVSRKPAPVAPRPPPDNVATIFTPAGVGLPSPKSCDCQFKTATGSISTACVRKRDVFRCSCRYKSSTQVCPQVLTVTDGKEHLPDGAHSGTMNCVDRARAECDPLDSKMPDSCRLTMISQKNGSPVDQSECHGYVPGLTAGDPQVTGKWSCSICNGALIAPKFTGKTGDTCTGFEGSTGKPVTGVLRC